MPEVIIEKQVKLEKGGFTTLKKKVFFPAGHVYFSILNDIERLEREERKVKEVPEVKKDSGRKSSRRK